MSNVRRFCRNVNITDINFIKRCIYLWIDEKSGRKDVQRFLAKYAGLPYKVVREAIACGDLWFWTETIERIAKDVRTRLLANNLNLPPIRFKDRYDDGSEKWRRIGIQAPIHQIFDYVAVEGCREMFGAKIGPYQMASLPGRGQEAGAKAILRWLQLDAKHTRYYAQADIRKCYPSICHDAIKAMFARDIKNPELLWLICELIDTFPEGLSIGSYFSQYACNYFLSKAYHYANEQLFRIRKKRNGSQERIRLVYHTLFYADDILFLGASKKDVEQGMIMLGKFIREELKLEIKPGWKQWEVDYIDADGKHHGHYIDMMGYRVYRDHIAIRRRTFKKIRRTIIRAERRIETGNDIPLDMALRLSSYGGKIDHSNSAKISAKHNLPKSRSMAGKVISCHGKMLAEKKRRREEEYERWKCAFSDSSGGNAIQRAPRRNGGGLDPEEHNADERPF